MTSPQEAAELVSKPWRDMLSPHIARFEAADVSGGRAVYNAEGSRAMSAMLSQIADYLDRANALIESLTKERDQARADRDSQQRVAIKAMERIKELENIVRPLATMAIYNRLPDSDDMQVVMLGQFGLTAGTLRAARQVLKDQPT